MPDKASRRKEIEEFINRSYAETESYSKEISSICRQLAFAEGALFWFSKINLNTHTGFLIAGFILLLSYFIFDALQYIYGLYHSENFADRCSNDYEEHKIYAPDHYKQPKISGIDNFFYLKLLALASASIVLIYCFINGLTTPTTNINTPNRIFYYEKS